MRFNLWFVVLLALGPIFILFAGLNAAGGFQSLAGWTVTVLAVAAGLAAGLLAMRSADEDLDATSEETTSHAESPVNDAHNRAWMRRPRQRPPSASRHHGVEPSALRSAEAGRSGQTWRRDVAGPEGRSVLKP